MKLVYFAACSSLLLAASAAAHVTVWPKESSASAHEKYEVRVPNEKQVDTIAIEVRFPAGLRVTSLEQKPGWITEPVRDHSGIIVAARWSGKLPPLQFAEFGVLAVNPGAQGDLSWKATQVFADGTKLEWSGAQGSKTPAPQVAIK